MNEPRWSVRGPQTVPEANRSPVRSAGAVDGQVRQLLRRRPVHAAERRPADTTSPLSRDLEGDVQAPRLGVASSR